MSIKMYCYILPKETFWDSIEKIRTWADNGINVTLEHVKSYQAFNDISKNLAYAFGLEIQLFEVDEYPDSYVFRAIEGGYAFMNKAKDICPEIEYAFYDDRSDVPEECLKYRPLVDVVDDLIKSRKYMLVPIMDEERISDLFFNSWTGRRKDANRS